MDNALSNNITVYDASYIIFAKQLNIPIAGNDEGILEYAPKYNIQVYNLDQFLKNNHLTMPKAKHDSPNYEYRVPDDEDQLVLVKVGKILLCMVYW